MVNWQITAATFKCELVHEEVTLLVHKDWSVKCTGHQKYADRKASRRNGNGSRCQGDDCELARDYRRKLQEEEKS